MADLFSFEGVAFRGVSSGLVKVRFFNAILGLTIFNAILIPLSIWVTGWIWIAVAVVTAIYLWRMLLIVPQVKAFQYAPMQNELLIKNGLYFKQITAIPYGRIQYVEASQGPLMRYFQINSLQVHTAAGSTEGNIDGLHETDAVALRSYLSARCESEMIGL